MIEEVDSEGERRAGNEGNGSKAGARRSLLQDDRANERARTGREHSDGRGGLKRRPTVG